MPRVTLISGASGGLGEAVTQAFLNNGDIVAGLARNWKRPPASGAFVAVEADLTTAGGCRTAVAEVVARCGRLDVLAHCLGGFAGGQPVAETADETWNGMLNLNLTAAFHLCRAALPHLIASGAGRIIAVGSRAALETPATLSAYNVSKAGLNALIRTIAAETKHRGVTANVVMPSVIDTPANRAADPSADFSNWVPPARIASLMLWLASDAAADVSGALIPIYGRA